MPVEDGIKVDVIRTARRTGSSLILESRLFTKIILESRLFAKIILESRLFANVTRIWQRTGYSLILEPRLFAWRLYEGQEPLQLQPGDWIPRMSNISSIVRNPPKRRSKQLCNQVNFFSLVRESEDKGSVELVVWETRVVLLQERMNQVLLQLDGVKIKER